MLSEDQLGNHLGNLAADSNGAQLYEIVYKFFFKFLIFLKLNYLNLLKFLFSEKFVQPQNFIPSRQIFHVLGCWIVVMSRPPRRCVSFGRSYFLYHFSGQ